MKTSAFAILLISVLGTAPAPASFAVQESSGPAGMLVSIGEHALYLSCSGATGNGPTVILEAGGGGTSADWSLVRDRLGGDMRTCAYDRAGAGRSEPGPLPRTMRQEVFELHLLLGAADVKPPYVLVGQSIGGLLARLYVETFPDDVVGVVLVDPTHESAVLGSLRYGGWVRLREKATGRAVPEPRGSTAGGPADDPEADYMAEEFQRMFLVRQKVPQPLGQRPLVVLAAGKRPAPPPGTSEPLWRTLRDERDEQVRDLAGLSANAKFVRDDTSGHSIHRDNPSLVALSIEEVHDAAMRGSRLDQPHSEHE
jgi:pimeloyl-ACP methyl ester carboxylesterase